MQLTVLGSSASVAGPGEANSGYLVETERARVLVDCGAGVVGRLLAVADPADLDAVLISHTHCDHCVDLLQLRYVLRRRGGRCPTLYVPPGGCDALLAAAESLNPENGRLITADLSMVEYDPASPLRIKDLTVRFRPVVHYVPTWAFVLDADTRLVYSADTGLFDGFASLAEEADLFLCEATFQDASEAEAGWGHLTARQAAIGARLGGARRLMLTHIWYELNPDRSVREARTEFDGPVSVALAGQRLAV